MGTHVQAFLQANAQTIKVLTCVSDTDGIEWELGYKLYYDKYHQLTLQAGLGTERCDPCAESEYLGGHQVGPDSPILASTAYYTGYSGNKNYLQITNIQFTG